MKNKKENKIIKNYNKLKFVGLFMFFFFSLFSFSKTYAEIRSDGLFFEYENVSGSLWGTPSLNDDNCHYSGTNCIREIFKDGVYQEITIWNSSSAETLEANGTWHYQFFDYSTTTGNYLGYSEFIIDEGNIYIITNQETSSLEWFTSPDWNVANSNATSTTNATFTFSYYIATEEIDNYNEVCLSLTKEELSPTEYFICEDIVYAGTHTFSTTTTLTNNSVYDYYGIILGTGDFPYNKSTLSSRLLVGSVPSSGIIPAGWILPVGDGNATTTNAEFGDWLNVPNLLKTKIPFGYIFQIGTILLNLESATTYTIPTGTFSFKFGNSTTSIDMFSTTTITRFMPSGFLTLFRGLLATIEWVGLGFYLWRRGHNLIT